MYKKKCWWGLLRGWAGSTRGWPTRHRNRESASFAKRPPPRFHPDDNSADKHHPTQTCSTQPAHISSKYKSTFLFNPQDVDKKSENWQGWWRQSWRNAKLLLAWFGCYVSAVAPLFDVERNRRGAGGGRGEEAKGQIPSLPLIKMTSSLNLT